MNKLRIVFGTNDGKKVIKHHFGDSKIFTLYELNENGELSMIKSIKNRAKGMKEKKHGDDNKRMSVLDQLGEIDIMIAGSLSPNFIKINTTTTAIPCISRVEDIDRNLDIILRKFSDFKELIDSKADKNIIPEIPVIREE